MTLCLYAIRIFSCTFVLLNPHGDLADMTFMDIIKLENITASSSIYNIYRPQEPDNVI